MTAQILLNILRHSIIKMEGINLLILDECHHAVKKHPYSLVMSEFYHTTPKEKRPAVFGMTASPVNLKGTVHFCGARSSAGTLCSFMTFSFMQVSLAKKTVH